MGRSPSKRASKSPRKCTAATSNKPVAHTSPSKRLPVQPGATFAELEALARKQTSGPDSTHAESHTPPEGRTQSVAPTQDSHLYEAFNAFGHRPSVFQTPLRQHHGAGVFSSNPFTVAISGTLDEQASQAKNGELSQVQTEVDGLQTQSMVLSPLPPSSPMVETELRPRTSSSPMTQSSFPPSSPSKPPRTRATQKDPLFGRVKGAAKGSQPWNIVRDRGVPAPRIEVSESTRRYRRELEKIICRVSDSIAGSTPSY
ncbi:hypothetical protein GYMLUDRAFT_982449 [Collybiopsis luxurians FD-317 M1]|uniref:Uncharacterized protein n=1 Tax=Collybiopsis luxurians FD-317 M1 TaxID=944289 RepID=A0A0D0C8R5_9AGAR|nr:hypothetical protein GYMLUDRAFT_982449 [Collybiopsis luxurians FD-317 M1]